MGLKVFEKSIWKKRSGHVWSFICPMCKAGRKVPFRSRPGAIHFFQIGLTSVIFALLTSPWLKWKGVVSFVPFWSIFETIYRLRMRASLSCPHCGFDPYLFLIDSDRSKKEMDAYWRKKFADKGIPYPEPPKSKLANVHPTQPKPSNLRQPNL